MKRDLAAGNEGRRVFRRQQEPHARCSSLAGNVWRGFADRPCERVQLQRHAVERAEQALAADRKRKQFGDARAGLTRRSSPSGVTSVSPSTCITVGRPSGPAAFLRQALCHVGIVVRSAAAWAFPGRRRAARLLQVVFACHLDYTVALARGAARDPGVPHRWAARAHRFLQFVRRQRKRQSGRHGILRCWLKTWPDS